MSFNMHEYDGDKPWPQSDGMPPSYVGNHTCKIEPKFVNCSTMGCTASSGRGESDSITLRAGFSNCYKHLDSNMAKDRVANSLGRPDLSRITVIFYHLGLAKDGQVEQLSAVSSHAERFSSVIRTSVRANMSPNLRGIPPELYNMLAEHPKEVMMNFCRFIRRVHSMNREGDTEMRNVVLMAHAGYCKDHVHLLRTMMGCGITPPDFRFADSLLLFMMDKASDENSDVASLVAKHAAWFQYKPNDVDCEARVLRELVMAEFRPTEAACYAFSISCEEFMERTGLSMHPIQDMSFYFPVWPGAIICEESGNIIRP